jgi:L-threonylcarbamoyladenylate synthase
MARVLSEAVLREAVRTVKGGGVIAYPTEYCYGLGCAPDCIPAIRRILDIKHRDRGQGLILVAAGIEQLLPWADLSARTVRELVQGSWPGPVTWLVPPGRRASLWLCGEHDTLGVRVTAHAQAASLCRYASMPLVSTSANRSGQAEMRSAHEVRVGLANIDYVVPGNVGNLSGPTEIRDALSGRILREPTRPATDAGMTKETVHE